MNRINNRYWALVTILVILFLTAIIFSCDRTTSPRMGKIIGSITLINDSGNPANDPLDNSGVTVVLYALAELDTAIVRANQTYPEIGLTINQETEFDHRSSSPLYSGVTDSEGLFSISSISPGLYNIVISKDGWGWRCLYDCLVNEGENNFGVYFPNSNTNQPFELYPERIITNLDSITLMKEDHTYKVMSDATLAHDVVIQGGTLLLIQENCNLTIIGDLTTFNTGSDKFSRISVAGDDIGYSYYFGRIMVQGDANISRIVYGNTLTGIQFLYGDVTASFLRGEKGPSSMIFRQCNSVHVSRVTVSDIGELLTSMTYNNIYTTDGGLDLTECESIIEKSVFVRCRSGVKVRENNNAVVSDCYFAYNTIGSEAYYNDSTIEHNYFSGNYFFGVRVYDRCSPTIINNEFFGIRGINIGLDISPSHQNCTPAIHQNNFSCQDYSMRIIAYNTWNVTATNNYFYTTSSDMIAQMIIDQNDYNPADTSNMVIPGTAFILYEPFLMNKVHDAGIRS